MSLNRNSLPLLKEKILSPAEKAEQERYSKIVRDRFQEQIPLIQPKTKDEKK